MVNIIIFKFDHYWSQINGVMTIGAILIPKYKMKMLDYFFPFMCESESPNELYKVKNCVKIWFVNIKLRKGVREMFQLIVILHLPL